MPRRKAWNGSPPASPGAARRRLVDAAVQVVERVGLEGARLSHVAELAGVTRQTVYRYFGDADDLFQSAAALVAGGFLERMRAAAAAPDDPVDRVLECVVFTACELPADPHLGVLAGQPDLDPDALLGLGFVQEELGRLTDGRLPPADRDDLAGLLLHVLLGLLAGPTPDEDVLRQRLRTWLGPGVRARLAAG